MDLLHNCEIRAIQVNFADFKSGIYDSDSSVYTQFRIFVSSDEKKWYKVADLSGEKKDRPNAYLQLEEPVKARYIKYEHIYVAAKNLAISDVRVFGNAEGKNPDTPKGFQIRRDRDERNVFIKWQRVKEVVGYNILWGIAPDKLNLTYQVFADKKPDIEIRALNKGQEYFFAIESFNENGISKMSEVIEGK